ncbi:hypothetical protein OG625_06225 [Streptomyces sp. NBC_01351]|uniref:hypothetical protein n=1 Tax=Streptomyces sp. NBC_01351 TaxID=2903833 RepID=UPI002E33E823|nr:hypothetical protein [Streptomyces sp. NBC_01351]
MHLALDRLAVFSLTLLPADTWRSSPTVSRAWPAPRPRCHWQRRAVAGCTYAAITTRRAMIATP